MHSMPLRDEALVRVAGTNPHERFYKRSTDIPPFCAALSDAVFSKFSRDLVRLLDFHGCHTMAFTKRDHDFAT